MHPDPLLFSSYMVEIDIIELYPWETLLHILRRVLKCARDIDWVTWHRISKSLQVEYELQRTTVSDMEWENAS